MVSSRLVKRGASGPGGVASSADGCRLTKSANQTIASAASAAITFDGEAFDRGGYHDNATNNSRITIPTGRDGVHLFGAAHQWDADSYGIYWFKLNGTTDIPGGDRKTQDLTGGQTFTALDLAAGDYVEYWVSNSGADDAVRGGSGSSVYASFWCVRIGS